MLRFFEPVRGEHVYCATQISSDYLRNTGVDGIKYRSTEMRNGLLMSRILLKNTKSIMSKIQNDKRIYKQLICQNCL